jgi:alpha-tubulin suppressor-like RCC1 family protein
MEDLWYLIQMDLSTHGEIILLVRILIIIFTRAAQIGFATSVSSKLSPTALPMPGGATVAQIGAGEKVGFVVLNNGSFVSWGYSVRGLTLNGLSSAVTEYGPRVRNTTMIGPITGIASKGRCKAGHLIAQSGKVYFWGYGGTGVSGNLYRK